MGPMDSDHPKMQAGTYRANEGTWPPELPQEGPCSLLICRWSASCVQAEVQGPWYPCLTEKWGDLPQSPCVWPGLEAGAALELTPTSLVALPRVRA